MKGPPSSSWMLGCVWVHALAVYDVWCRKERGGGGGGGGGGVCHPAVKISPSSLGE